MNLYEFISHYGIVGLSIATAVGLSFSTLVNSISNEFILPLIGILFHVRNIKGYNIKIMGNDFGIGIILSNILSYLVLVSIIIGVGYYLLYFFTSKIREIKLETDKEQLQTSKEILLELKKFNSKYYN